MSALALVVDAGGTRTVAALARGDEFLARRQGNAGSVRGGRAMQAAAAIAATCRQVMADAAAQRVDVLVVGAAGAGRDPERGDLAAALRAERLADRVVVTTDAEIARLAAFGDGPGILLIAGTGSVALGRDAAGAEARVGGWGWQAGDEGSGYAIGRAALQAVTRAEDGRAPPTSLRAALLEAARAADFDALVRWAGQAGPTEVAGLAARVAAQARAGDAAAAALVAEAAAALAGLVTHAATRLASAAPLPVAMTGGLLGPDSPVREAVRARLAGDGRLAVQEGEVDPLRGALRLA